MNSFILSLFLPVSIILSSRAQPPSEPILRVEIGMHTAVAERFATDAAGKYLLTCSEDKTARLWDAVDGQLLNTLRIPIGGAKEGKLSACSLSTDGTLAALGGFTGYEWDKTYCIYIINTQTGRIIHRITGLQNNIWALQFSPDGKWLAASMADVAGVAIFETNSWSEAKRLDGYTRDVFGIAFDKNNRLATVCYDGNIRLYNKRFKIIGTEEVPGRFPYCIAFNPSGNLLAVGYINESKIEVRNAKNIDLAYGARFLDVLFHFDDLSNALSFSADGHTLYSGGIHQGRDNAGMIKNALSIWNINGQIKDSEIPLFRNTIFDIKGLPNGNIAVLGAFPEVAVLSKTGKVLWYKSAPTDQCVQLRINNAGTAIGFIPELRDPLRFDVTARSLIQQVSTDPAAANNKPGLSVQANENVQDEEKRNYCFINYHKTTFKEREEIFLCSDVNENGEEAIIGTTRNLYKADAQARILWQTTLPSQTFHVKISGNGKTVVASLADGTIRWYSMEDGKELLAFYLNSDQKRWVLFTPSGYYDASAGADDMLGWHINNGVNEAPSFYPVSRFKQQYYRPDIIDAILKTYDREQAIKVVNSTGKRIISAQESIKEKLPPVVTITDPLSGVEVSNELVKLKYSLKTPENTQVKNIKVLVNGRPVTVQKGIKLQPSNNYSINVNIPRSDCTITLLAENENGISPESNLHIKYKLPDKPIDTFVKKPKLYVLAIGISEYQNADYKLKYAAIDANGFIAVIRQQKGNLYEDVIIKSLIDRNATRESIQDGLQWIQDQTSQKDIAMIFYAGHGMDDNNGIFYMLPVGADVGRLRSTCLNFEELKQTVSSIAGKVVVFIDACHSGDVMGASARRGSGDINAVVNELSGTPNGAVTFTSSTGTEYSLEKAEWKHGAFTKALLEGLSGKAAVPSKNKVTVKSLDAFISERVKELTNGKQHPTSVVPPNVPDFPIAAW